MNWPRFAAFTLTAGLGAASLSGCAITPTEGIIESTHGVSYKIIEREHVGSEEYPLNRGSDVDQNSEIAVVFADPKARSLAELQVDPLWDAATGWITKLESLIQSGIDIDLRLERVKGGAELERLLADIEAHDEAVAEAWLSGIKIAAVVQPLALRGEDDPEFLAWFMALPGDNFLDKWAGYFAGLIEDRRKATERELKGKSHVKVLVAAFTGRSGHSSRIHVRGYDNIEGASPYSAPRIGLDLTDMERARLQRELEQSKRAVTAINQLDEKIDSALDGTAALGQKLGDTITQLAEDVNNTLTKLSDESAGMQPLAAVETNLATVSRELRQLAGNLTGDERAKAKAAVTKLADLAKAGSESAGAANKTVLAARELLQIDLGKQVLGLLTGTSDIPAKAALLSTHAQTTVAKLQEAAGLASEFDQLSSDLNGVDLVGVADSLTPSELKSAVADWIGQLQPWLGVVNAISTRMSGESSELKAAAQMVSSKDGVSLPRTLDDLRDGVVELGENVEVGDHVRVVIEISGSDDKELEQHEYTFRITRLGLHREIHGEAILARGANGATSAKRWSPNVAAMASWHYRYRRPTTNFGQFVNWLNPGLGIHAATLSQDPDEGVEFGLGVQIRLFDGLFFTGVGGNLSVTDDHKYYFVGTDLLKLLGELSD